MRNLYMKFQKPSMHGSKLCYKQTRGPCNAHLSIIALGEPDLELIKENIQTKIYNDYINK